MAHLQKYRQEIGSSKWRAQALICNKTVHILVWVIQLIVLHGSFLSLYLVLRKSNIWEYMGRYEPHVFNGTVGPFTSRIGAQALNLWLIAATSLQTILTRSATTLLYLKQGNQNCRAIVLWTARAEIIPDKKNYPYFWPHPEKARWRSKRIQIRDD